MPRKYGLTRLEIENIMKNGKSLFSPFFSLRIIRKMDLKIPKVAFVASKKVFPLAVNRNKARRRAREAFRPIIKDISPVMVVVLLKKQILDTEISKISLELLNTLRKS